MQNISKKRVTFVILIFILLFQLVISVYYGSRKRSLFIDEVLSFTLANHQGGGFIGVPQEEWLDGTWYTNSLSVNEGHIFDYSIPYKNQIEDVHPPLFYFLLHTTCSLVPGSISFWTGIGLNILFFLECTVLIYLLGKEVFRSEMCALLCAFFYSISFGGINTMTFIRMYMLMTYFLLLHTYVYFKLIESEKISLKTYFFLGLTLVGGILTQYYFLVAAFFFGVWYTFKFLLKRKWRELFRYWITLALGICVSVILFPTMLKHIFFGGRGVEARNNFIAGENYLGNLKKMYSILDAQMFGGMLLILILGITILIITRKLRGGGQNPVKGLSLLFVCGGYFFLVTKVAPYQTDRYLMPIYPFIYFFIIGNLYLLLAKYMKPKWSGLFCIILFGWMSIVNLKRDQFPYLYDKSTREHNAIMNEYKENLCVYIGQDNIYQYYDIQELKEYTGFYNIVDVGNEDKIAIDLNRLQEEDSIILYLGKSYSIEEAKDFLNRVLGGKYVKNVLQLEENSWRTIYLITDIHG